MTKSEHVPILNIAPCVSLALFLYFFFFFFLVRKEMIANNLMIHSFNK